jgi:hypothetical protein
MPGGVGSSIGDYLTGWPAQPQTLGAHASGGDWLAMNTILPSDFGHTNC